MKMEKSGKFGSISKDKPVDYSMMSSEDLDTILAEKLLPEFKSWVQLMFQGELCTITKCGVCEHLSVREESFMNLSIDIEENVSLSYCLKKFSNKEYLKLGDKF
jgi:ubiquitin C-terminal hydrolase